MKKQTALTPVFSGFLGFLLAFLLLSAPAGAADARNGVEVTADLAAGMGEGREVKLSFPSPMIPEESVGTAQANAPLEWTPALAGKWVWQSQTELTFTAGKGVRPDTTYLLRLRDGTVDLNSKPVVSSAALLSTNSPRFTLASSYTFAESASGEEPVNLLRLNLSFSYAVSAAQVAELVYFQDRDNRRRYPVKVYLPGNELVAKNIEVMSRDPLPPKRTFDLIVEGIDVPDSGYRQPVFSVIPLDFVAPRPPAARPPEIPALQVLKVSASNLPLAQPAVRIEFNKPVAESEGAKVRFTPPVEGLKAAAEASSLLISGPFRKDVRYAVELPADLAGADGSRLPAPSRWGAAFKVKRGAIVFPDAESSYQRRASLGVQFPFLQINASEVRWRLAKVPPEKIHAVQRRLLEFQERDTDPLSQDPLRDPATQEPLYVPTELLMESSRLDILAEGTFENTPEDAEVKRMVSWVPDARPPEGPCLLEVHGKDAKGRVVGNRALIWFTEFSVLKKNTEDGIQLRAARYEDGSPLQNVRVVWATNENVPIEEGRTDKDGVVIFKKDNPAFGGLFLFSRDGALVAYPFQTFRRTDDGVSWLPPVPQTRAELVTDRPLYRPEHTVKFKGFVRDTAERGSSLVVPQPRKLSVQVCQVGEDDTTMQTTDITTDAFGGFEGEWKIPQGAGLGSYVLRLLDEDKSLPAYARRTIAVEEFRPPSFSVDLQQTAAPGEACAVSLKSTMFHGAPNSGAKVKWSARWKAALPDRHEFSIGRNGDYDPASAVEIIRGETQLGADGAAELRTGSPFKDGVVRGWFNVFWEVEVTGFDSQSVTEPLTASVFASDVYLGARAVERKDKAIEIDCFAVDPRQQPVSGVPVGVKVARVLEKTASIQIAPHIYRRERSTVYEEESALQGVTPFKPTVLAKGQGKYRITVNATGKGSVPPREFFLHVTGTGSDAPAEFKVETESTFKIEKDREFYTPGQTAVLSIQAPFPGQAWVSVEAAGAVLKQFPVKLEGDSGKVEIPVTKDLYPNAYVSVHLLRPAEAGAVPVERTGAVELTVRRPDLELEVTPVLKSAEVEPGAQITGELTVKLQGSPVPDADVTLYAVDDALLVAGAWKPPTLFRNRSDRRPSGVSTQTNNLSRLAGKIAEEALTQKGFIIGDGDDDAALAGRKKVRKDFLPLATWQTGLRTDANGTLRIDFKAPDSLTRYRLVALVQTRESQFGVGLASVEVAKSLQIEPALPRFLREGDEVELRAVVRQKNDPSLNVDLVCNTSLSLLGNPTVSRVLEKNAPAVFVFKAKVGPGGSAKIGFSTKSGAGDAVEMALPVFPPTLLQHEIVFNKLQKNSVAASMQEIIPQKWEKAAGSVTLSLSSSEWLPQLSALPLVLEYPHGCGEQISTRVLAYTIMGGALAFLPDDGAHDRAYRKRVEQGLERLGSGQLPDGGMPYWMGGSYESPFVTVHACWAAHQAADQDWTVPAHLLDSLKKRVDEITRGKSAADLNTRCYALLVLSGLDPLIGSLEPTLRDLYLKRGKPTGRQWTFGDVSDEARAFLAVAMHRWNVMPQEKETLLKEIDRPRTGYWFDHRTFSSPVREASIQQWAEATIHPEKFKGAAGRAVLERVAERLNARQMLSTQENFWTLLAFKTLLEITDVQAPDFAVSQPEPVALSKNKASARWAPEPLANIRTFSPALPGQSLEGLTCMLAADFRMQSFEDEQRTDRGFRVERVVVNRTEPNRKGTQASPYRLGDELTLAFRIRAGQLHYYVALEGELPACFESVNTRLPSATGRNPASSTQDTFQPELSNVELRDKTTCFYFDELRPGTAVFETSVRVTSAGTFHWPATQIYPMYDGRFSGTSAAGMCYVVDK